MGDHQWGTNIHLLQPFQKMAWRSHQAPSLHRSMKHKSFSCKGVESSVAKFMGNAARDLCAYVPKNIDYACQEKN